MATERRQKADNVQLRQIEERAYAIWESEGKPHGRHLEHWLRAEVEFELSVNTKHPAKPQERTAALKKPVKMKRRKK